MKYLYKQKQKELVKRKEKFKYEKSKIKVRYDEKKEKEKEDDNTETELILKVNEEEKENSEKDLSILLEDEENELDEDIDNISKLIYDNSYLFKHKKKEIPIKQEVINILNESKNSESNENNTDKSKNEENQEFNSENSSISNNIEKYEINSLNKNTNSNRFKNLIRYPKKTKIKKTKFKESNKQLSLFHNDLEINEKIEEKEESQNSDEELEKKLNEFFMKIKNLKNNNDNLADLDFLMNEEFKDETDKKFNISRRLNDFIENRDNFRAYDKNLKPKFNFMSPIKFSVKDLFE